VTNSPALRALLWPFAVAYEGVVRTRASLYRRGVFRAQRLDGTVISVGNLTVGGTGKTPMVLWLAERLATEGHRPAILTRGYRGNAQGDASGLPTSDEVALLRERLGARAQLGVGKDRYASGRTLERHGAQWFILDDGFQHLALGRDADIVLVDATDPFGGGRLLPAGRLREPKTALGRADVVVITRSEHAPAVESVVQRFTQAPIFYARTQLEAVLRVPALLVPLPDGELTRANFFAFCGIGNPSAFFDDLLRWGVHVKGRRAFRDHHRYVSAETERLERDAMVAGADAMICTEKDVFNLRHVLPTRLPVYACRIGLGLREPEPFWQAVMAAVQRRRQRRQKVAA
jgi:tetraacyldisaccharide 4'-kinase